MKRNRSLGVRVPGVNEGQMKVFEVTGKKEMSDMEYLMHQTALGKKEKQAAAPKAQAPSRDHTA